MRKGEEDTKGGTATVSESVSKPGNAITSHQNLKELPHIAQLKGEDADWSNGTVSFFRKKTGVPVLVHLGKEAQNVLKDLRAEGLLFPYLASVRPGDRATEFGQRCRQLGIRGITLHSYRYAWADRAKTAGYPERFAREALGHCSVWAPVRLKSHCSLSTTQF